MLETHPSPWPDRLDLVVFDFDGVMTDNAVYVDGEGRETVRCDRADGLGVEMLREAGVPMLILSREANPVVAVRARKLGIPCQNAELEKERFLRQYCTGRGIDLGRVAYVGNDVNDLACMRMVGLPVAVGDAQPSVKAAAALVLTRSGGHGAVREICDLVMEHLGIARP